MGLSVIYVPNAATYLPRGMVCKIMERGIEEKRWEIKRKWTEAEDDIVRNETRPREIWTDLSKEDTKQKIMEKHVVTMTSTSERTQDKKIKIPWMGKKIQKTKSERKRRALENFP